MKERSGLPFRFFAERMLKLAEINGVRCMTMTNGMMGRLSNRKWRELLGRYIFGLTETEEPSLTGGAIPPNFHQPAPGAWRDFYRRVDHPGGGSSNMGRLWWK